MQDKIVTALLILLLFIFGVIIINAILNITPDGVGKAILAVGLSIAGIASVITLLIRLFSK
ncbi:MAG: hypothetical protein ISS52_07810 [Dehalococcoidia bacterium]|nr:hypothetical protein [Dehalococcoidia bacterium]